MKVVAFNGSPRRDGNTATLLGVVQKELEGLGLHEKDVEKDAEGIEIMRTLGQNMGWLMKRIEG